MEKERGKEGAEVDLAAEGDTVNLQAVARYVAGALCEGNGVLAPPPEGQPRGSWGEETVKAIAMDIGKAVVHHIETMYPAAVAACSSTFKLSVRNSVYNEIMAAIKVNDQGQIEARLKERKSHRRKIKAAYTKIRR